MQRIAAILLFYKPMFVWSFAVTLVITIFNPLIFSAIITKLFLTFFAWYLVNETKTRQKLIALKNIGVSTFKLFSTIFFIDIVITIGFLIVIKEFI
ncbi:hypothetical protein [Winogradskyella sp. 3972H.M.0a.05]|uniref:hypothetical protein n=1 Tax=Winogradskyella sp. 3972H.M.0a.05 TaxID=2950277 RepID=UPI0033983A91